MKNISVTTFRFAVASLSVVGAAFLIQACGGGNNSAPLPIAPAAGCVGLNCPGAAANVPMNPMALLDVQITGNKQQEYAELCTGPYVNVRHLVINGVNVCRFRLSGNVEETINESAILTPTSVGGGLDTGIHLFVGDVLELSADGHYSHRKPNAWKEALTARRSGCHNEINVDGSTLDEDSDDNMARNAENDQPAGLFAALSNGHAFVAEPIAISRETKTLSATGGSEDLFVGYNTDRIECGNIKLRYHVIRCMDANLNTYPCPKE